MKLPAQTVALLHSARELVETLQADAILIMPEMKLAWKSVQNHLDGCKLLVASSDPEVRDRLEDEDDVIYLDIDPGPTPTQERMSLALIEAVRSDHLRHNAHVVVLYNGIDIGADHPEHIDSLSILHLGEHLERLSSKDLRQLDTKVPLEILRAVVDLATEIGREGREGKPVGTMFVVGDAEKVMKMSRPVLMNPFKGHKRKDRDIRDPAMREQVKEYAKLDGAFIISREGICEAGCMHINPGQQDITLSKGFGTRHGSAAATSKATNAIAVVVSESTGTARIFQNGEVVLTIEPLVRPMTWRLTLDAQEDGDSGPRNW